MLSVYLLFSVSLLQCSPSPVHNERRNGSPGTWLKQSHLASLYFDTKFVSLHNYLLHDTLLNGFLVFVSRLNDNRKSNSLSGRSLRESPEGFEAPFPIFNGNGLYTLRRSPGSVLQDSMVHVTLTCTGLDKFYFVLFLTRSHYVALPALESNLQSRLASSLQRSTCFCFLSAGTLDVPHHAQSSHFIPSVLSILEELLQEEGVFHKHINPQIIFLTQTSSFSVQQDVQKLEIRVWSREEQTVYR